MPGIARIVDQTGGRNGGDSPFAIPEDQCAEAYNVEWYGDVRIAKKRAGCASQTLNDFTGQIWSLMAHVPTAESAAELWAADSSTTEVRRLAGGGGTWASITLYDAYDGINYANSHVGVSFNSKLFHAYDSAVNRLHCWDGTSHRRAGLGAPTAAPTNPAAGAGAVTDTRKAKATLIVKSGSTVLRRSEASPISTALNYIASYEDWRLAGAPGEGETHWELWVASNKNNYGTWHYIGEAAIGVDIRDNTATLTSYAPPTVGTNLCPPSCKFVVADDGRLVMTGAHELSAAANSGQVSPSSKRVWWTAPPGHVDINDNPASYNDERVVITQYIKSYLDVEEDTTGLASPVNGVIYVFSCRSIWRLTATGDVTKPFQRRTVTRKIGAVAHHSIISAEDEQGRPAVYFLSERGPYRITVGGGLEFLGWDVRDLWDTVNLEAERANLFGLYYTAKRQIHWWIATGTANAPNEHIVFHTDRGVSTGTFKGVRKGWARWSIGPEGAYAACMFPDSYGATMGRRLKPYVALGNTLPGIVKFDSGTDDIGAGIQAYITTRPIAPWGRDVKGQIAQPYIVAKAATGVELRMTLIRDLNAESVTDDTVLTAVGSETYVEPLFDRLSLADIKYAQIKIGDINAGPSDNGWTIDEINIPWTESGAIAVYTQPGT